MPFNQALLEEYKKKEEPIVMGFDPQKLEETKIDIGLVTKKPTVEPPISPEVSEKPLPKQEQLSPLLEDMGWEGLKKPKEKIKQFEPPKLAFDLTKLNTVKTQLTNEIPADIPELKSHQSFWSGIKNIPNYIKLYSKYPQELKGTTGRTGVKALEVITWPFMRFLTGTATLAMGVERTAEYIVANIVEKRTGFPLATPEEGKEALETLGAGVKAFVPFTKLDPEKVNSWGDFAGAYYKAQTGEEAPEWYKNIAGISFELGMLQIGRDTIQSLIKSAERLHIVQRTIQIIEEKKLPKWQVAKQRAKIRTIERNEEIKDLGKSLAGDDVTRLTEELSTKLGHPVSEEAVKLRLGQIIKGGITEQKGMEVITKPIIEDILKTGTKLRDAGLLGEETYITKLSRARINELLQKKNQLQTQLTKLQTDVPYKDALIKQASKLKIPNQEKLTGDLWDIATNISKKDRQYVERLSDIFGIKTTQPKKLLGMLSRYEKATLTERSKIIDELWELGRQNLGNEITGLKPLMDKISSMQRQFPGKAKQIGLLQDRIDAITNQVQQSYETGGTGYLGRFYQTKEEELAGRRFPFSGSKFKVRQPYAKAREAITFETRQAMGEIQAPQYPYVKRSLQANTDLQVNQLFNYASRNKNWVSDVWKKGLVNKPLPEAKSYGSLAGKYVHPKIYSDVTEMNAIKSEFGKIYDTIEGTWKLGKTVWNPSTHAHNLFGNSVLLDLSGMSHDQQVIYLTKALTNMKKGDPEWIKVRRIFGGSSMIKGEILDDMLRSISLEKDASGMSKVLNTFNNFIKTTSAKPAELYQFEEQLGKYMKYLQMRDKGSSIMSSVREAEKWLFDYSDLSTFEKNVARRFMPFYTFPRKAIPRVAEAMIKNPISVYKYPLIINGIEQYALSKLQITEKDYAEIKKTLPDYMQKGDYMLMPYRDANGDLRFLSLTYLFPIADITQGLANEPMETVIANPFFNAIADIKLNKSGFTGNPIYLKSDTQKERTAKKTLYLWYMATPPGAPRGQNWDKLYESLVGKKTKYETETGEFKTKRLLPETIAQTIFGLSTVPIDVGLQEEFHAIGTQKDTMAIIQELSKKIRDAETQLEVKNITEEKYNKLIEQYTKQWEDILQQSQE